MKIEQEINQQKPFQNTYQKAGVNILYTASWLTKKHADLLKPFGLTVQQFNILRILRGMKNEPATVKLLTERMIDKMSNASRLVDKLLQKKWVRREECKEDRRRVDIFITDSGLAVLNKASEALDNTFSTVDAPLAEEELQLLNELLDKLRD